MPKVQYQTDFLRKCHQQIAGGGAPPATGLLAGLAAYWKMDEASGPALDTHAGHDAQIVGTVTSAAGKIGTSRQFTTPGEHYLTVPNSAGTAINGGAFTFSVWLWLDSSIDSVLFAVHAVTSYQFIVNYRMGTTHLLIEAMGPEPNYDMDQLELLWSLPPTSWHHLLIVFDPATGDLLARPDGLPGDSVNLGSGLNPAPAPINFGRAMAVPDPQVGWPGRIDEVAYWRRALTPAEQDAVWNGGLGLPYEDFGTVGRSARPSAAREQDDQGDDQGDPLKVLPDAPPAPEGGEDHPPDESPHPHL